MSGSAGERRIVSVLVADLADSTPAAERLGPERYKFLLDELLALMREEVERYGGTLAQLTGDGVLALFGAPVAHGDDAERAVRAALSIRGAVDGYAGDVAPAYGIELRMRIAVNTGPVVVPAADAPPHILYNALGDTVNVAARLQALADVVIGPDTAHQVAGAFELDELGELELKGKREPVAAFRVLGVRRRRSAPAEARFVGRTDELAVLGEVLDGLVAGAGAVVTLSGEPGIGKSRLVAEVKERFEGRVRFLAGQAVSYAQTIPYWPMRELLRSWLGLGVSDTEARMRLELRAQLAAVLGREGEEAYPFLASLLGLSLPPEQERLMRDFARDAVQRQTFDWLYDLVAALAHERPLCVVLEDLHWSDEATLSLLEELLPAAEQSRVCFLLVHRSDPDHPAWQLVDRTRRRFRRLYVELPLGPLADTYGRALAEDVAGGELEDELAQLLAGQAGGNPYFVGEAIRDLRERGVLKQENGRFILAGEASIPAAVQEALQARLDRLDADARELVTTAAVVGSSFGLPLLERLLPRARLQATLSELQWLELVVEVRRGPAPEYRFRHGLVQEVAYAGLLESDRRRLHLRVGEQLAELHRDSPAEVFGLLAHHFTEADDDVRAVEYLLKAGDAARSIYADDEAIQLYRRALRFMERSGEDARAREILLKIALTHHLAFGYSAANEAFRDAFARPAPTPTRVEPTERVVWMVPAAWDREVAPGHSWSLPAWQLGANLFSGLVVIGRDLDLEPDLAERFTVSDDGRTYRFTLRDDVFWSDGTPVSAGDFAFTYERMVEEGTRTAFRLDGVRAVAVDPRTLEFLLREPRNDFLYSLGQPPSFPWPRHVHEREGADWHRAVPLVGNGPFVLVSTDEDHVVLEANPVWSWRRGNVREIAVELEASAAVFRERWRLGEFDVADDPSYQVADADDASVAERAPALWTWFFAFVPERAPVDDRRVRRALAHSIDRTGPAAAFGASATHTGGLLPPQMPGHSHRVAPAFDSDQARELLREVGGPDSLGEIVVACLDLWRDAASEVCSQLSAVGVQARLLSVPSDPELLAAIEEQAHAFVWAWGADTPDPWSGMLGPLLRDFPLYRDDELDSLLARAASIRDQEERLRLCREFERIWIGEQAALVSLAYGDRVMWRRPWLTGMWVNSLVMSRFSEATIVRT